MKKVAALLVFVLLLSGCHTEVGTGNALWRAIDRRNLEWVREALETTDPNNAPGRSGREASSALLYAMSAEWDNRVSRGPTDIFCTLLEAGADVNRRLSGGDTPCFWAVGLSDEAGIRYMELMLEYGADLSIKNHGGYTVLDEAVKGGHDKTAMFLMEKGIVPTENTIEMLFNRYYDSRDGRCSYALLRALIADYGLSGPEVPPAVRTVLLGKKPAAEDVAALDREGMDWLLGCVAAFGEPEALAALLSGEDCGGYADAEGWSLWEIAAGNGNRPMLEHLLKISDSGELVWAALNRAVAACRMDCIAVLLERFDAQCMEGADDADRKAEWLWRSALAHDNLELLTLLYEQGPLPNENGIFNCVRDAIEYGAQNSFAFLLEHFDVEPEYHLDMAGRYNNLAAAQFLIDKGVSQFSLDESLSTAAASGSLEVVQLLLDLGANPSFQEPTHGSPLLGAAQYGYLDVVELLLNYGADTRQVYWDEEDSILIETAFGSTRILARLIAAGAEVNYQNTDGATPLIYAVLNNRPENVSLLLENGADPNLVDIHGCTALSIAEEEDFDAIVSILKAAM